MYRSAQFKGRRSTLGGVAVLTLCLPLAACSGGEEPAAQVIRTGAEASAGSSGASDPVPLPAGQVPPVGDVPRGPVVADVGTGMILPDRVPTGTGVAGSGRLADGITVDQVEGWRSLWNRRAAVRRGLDGAGCRAHADGTWVAVRPVKGDGDALLLGTWAGRDKVLCTVGNAQVIVGLANKEVLGDPMFASLLVR